MSEITFENIVIDGVSGTAIVNDFDFIFTVSKSFYKWSLSNWVRSEKSKKSPKVRLTFKEPSIRVTSEPSEFDTLLKSVVIVDFVDDREKLDQFCDLISNPSLKSRPSPKEAQSTVETPSPSSDKAQSDILVESKTVSYDFDDTKRNVLESNEHLSRLYGNLISQGSEFHGLISPKDFWDHHKLELYTKVSQQLARSNLDGFVSVPPSSTVVNSQTVYNYTDELANSLLSEDETIRNLHKKLVVDKGMPEENFWKRILQSRYFYNLIGERIPENQILYDDIKGLPIIRSKRKLDMNDVLTVSDSSSELITLEDTRKKLRKNKYFKVNKRFGKNFSLDENRDLLVQRFNYHSFEVLGHTKSSSSSGHFDKDKDHNLLETEVEDYRKRKLLDVTQDDLQDKGDDEMINNLCIINSINIPGSVEYQQIPMKSESSESSNKLQFKLRNFSSFSDNSQFVEYLKNFDIIQYIKDTKFDDFVSRKMFVLNAKLCQSEKIIQSQTWNYDMNTVNKIKEIQEEIIEILQIYYKTYIPEQDKRNKLLLVLAGIKHKIELLHNNINISSHTSKTLQDSLFDQITAVENYDSKLSKYISNHRLQRSKS